jgi:D-alanine-D-alanine ligase
VGIVFGGVSPEHEVSVITSLQAAAAMDRDRFNPIPIYIGKEGRWYTGEELFDIDRYRDLDALRESAHQVAVFAGEGGRASLVELEQRRFFDKPRQYSIDVLFLGLHGGAGEDGGLQGLCNVLNVPFTSADVMGSAVGMDKVVSKYLCRDAGIPIVDFVAVRESQWADHEEEWLDRVEDELGYPVIVKPARLGSSIGIAKADERAELDAAIEEAFRYDDKVVIEDAIEHLKEINCSVLGDPDDATASVLEQPVTSEGEELLTYQEKYMRGGSSKKSGPQVGRKQRRESSQGMASLDRLIPAPLTDEQTDEIQSLAVKLFKLFECAGVVRIDFMIDQATEQVYFNEINTIPGSLSFYLWEPSGVTFPELVERMIDVAIRRHALKNGRVRSYDVNLLSERSLEGLKTAKA